MSELKIEIAEKVALVTGSNRGIGKAIVTELIAQGAKKVYAGARDVSTLADLQEKYGDKIVPVQLDVTNQEDIDKVAALATDINILINNAGALDFGGFFGGNASEVFEKHLAVNVHGLINVSKAHIDTLKNNDKTAIVNISSLAGLGNMPVINSYSVSKAAVHSITQGFRGELAKDNILVVGVYPGPIDTEMAKDFDMAKDSPENVAKAIVDGLANGSEDVFPDQMSVQVGKSYFSNPKGVEKEFSAYA